MDLIICKCAKCDARLGNIVNLWTKIGKNYLSPAACDEAEDDLKVIASGSVRAGDPGTLIEGCQLQDAECAACHAKLGQKCSQTPVNHVLNDGQLILRASTLVLRSALDGRLRISPKIKRVLKLRLDSGSSNVSRQSRPSTDYNAFDAFAPNLDSVDLCEIQAQLDIQNEDITRIGDAGYKMVSSLEEAVARVEQQMQQLRGFVDSTKKDDEERHNSLQDLKTDLADIKQQHQKRSNLTQLDQKLHATDSVVADLRRVVVKTQDDADSNRKALSKLEREISQLKDRNVQLGDEIDSMRQVAQEGIRTSKDYAFEVGTLRNEAKLLREELTKERALRQAADSHIIPSPELDILASSISRIGQKASQVESLQMEFELFKTRMQRLEGAISGVPTSRAEPRPEKVPPSGPTDEQNESRYGAGARQKRTLARRDDEQLNETPLKRLAVTSDYSSAATTDVTSTTERLHQAPHSAADSTISRRTRLSTIPKKRASARGSRGRKASGIFDAA